MTPEFLSHFRWRVLSPQPCCDPSQLPQEKPHSPLPQHLPSEASAEEEQQLSRMGWAGVQQDGLPARILPAGCLENWL